MTNISQNILDVIHATREKTSSFLEGLSLLGGVLTLEASNPPLLSMLLHTITGEAWASFPSFNCSKQAV